MLSEKTESSLVHRPHPLTRKNGLANQVNFWGLAHTFSLVQASNVENLLRHARSKICLDAQVERQNFTAVGELINNLTVSYALTTIWK